MGCIGSRDKKPLQIDDPRSLYPLSDPSEVLSHQPTLLHKETFEKCLYYDSATSFIVNNETFVAWTTKQLNNHQNSLVFNMTTGKVEKEFEESPCLISVVDTYPHHATFENKKWFYVADTDGILRVFDIADKKFNEIHTIDLHKLGRFFTGQDLTSAIIFDDVFNEIVKDPKQEKTLVAIHTGGLDYDGLMIYSLKGEEIKEIKNEGIKSSCRKMDFYHDEVNKRTYFILGWAWDAIKKYDLTTEKYIVRHTVNKKDITAMTVLFKGSQEKPENYVIFSYKDDIIRADIHIGSLENETIFKTIELGYDLLLRDIRVWNKENILVSIESIWVDKYPNSTLVFNTETWEHKKFDSPEVEKSTENLVITSVKKEVNYFPALVCCQMDGNVFLYQ